MSARYFSITFPEQLTKEPVVYSLAKYYEVEPNIFRAMVSGSHGWMVVSLSGGDERIDRALMDLKIRGATIQEGDKSLLDLKEPPSLNAIRVRLTAPEPMVNEPFITEMIKQYDVVVNIRAAKIEPGQAIIDMEISGALDSIDRAIDYLKKRGIRVEPIERTVIE